MYRSAETSFRANQPLPCRISGTTAAPTTTRRTTVVMTTTATSSGKTSKSWPWVLENNAGSCNDWSSSLSLRRWHIHKPERPPDLTILSRLLPIEHGLRVHNIRRKCPGLAVLALWYIGCSGFQSDCFIYLTNRKVNFHFQAPNNIIVLTFITFDTESGGWSCYDYLEIRDGNSAYSPLVGYFCGDEDDVPDHVLSTGNNMRLRWGSKYDAFTHQHFVLFLLLIAGLCLMDLLSTRDMKLTLML